jgi:NADP-dependent 3-hydroxy acid dehydrogenase YdfG
MLQDHTYLDLSGTAAIISGGTSGIGRATTKLLLQKGVNVLFFGLQEEVESTVAALSPYGNVYGMGADVGDPIDVRKVFFRADELFGTLDFMINNAAVPARSVTNTGLEMINKILSVNLNGYLYCSHMAVERMHTKGRGHIVNIGSLSGDLRGGGADIYIAAKSGIDGFSDSLRKQVTPWGIKVSQVKPGLVGTNLISESPEEQHILQEQGKMLLPEDVADAIVYLISQPHRVSITDITVRPMAQGTL